jgi:hypothetical protein
MEWTRPNPMQSHTPTAGLQIENRTLPHTISTFVHDSGGFSACGKATRISTVKQTVFATGFYNLELQLICSAVEGYMRSPGAVYAASVTLASSPSPQPSHR